MTSSYVERSPRQVRLPVLQTKPAPSSALTISEEERERSKVPFPGGFKHLPIELFRTERRQYVFDARHVTFFEVDRVAFDVLGVLREGNTRLDDLLATLPQHPAREIDRALQEVRALQGDGFLTPYRFERVARHSDEKVEEVLSKKMGGFTIFVTTECNLACSYCIYGGQYDQHDQLSNVRMDWETLRQTMDFLREHSTESKLVRLDFFGGEPLLAFGLIERGVQYLKSTILPGGPEVVVTVTSNGTVLTERILDFMLEHGVYVQFSLDGGAESHDEKRPFKGSSGRGSYAVILENLRKIHDRDPEYYRTHMRLKGVLTTEAVDRDDSDFWQEPLVRMLVQDGHLIYLNEEPHWDLDKDADYFDRIGRLAARVLAMRDLEKETDILDRLNVKQRALYGHTLGLFFDVQTVHLAFSRGKDAVMFTKGCLTGFQEGAVGVSGDISVCLKSAKGENFVIGNVREGDWFMDKIHEMNRTFHHDWSGCQSCYVQKMCDLCYEKLDGQGGQWVAGRSRFCQFNRQRFRTIFETMLRVAEENPALWKDLEAQLRFAATNPAARGEDASFESTSLYSKAEPRDPAAPEAVIV